MLQELSGAPVYAAYRYCIKNIPPDLGTHYKPIHGAFQLRTPCHYIQHRPFQPPGIQRLWSHRKSPFTGFGLYASFIWLARKKKTNQVILKKGQSFRWLVCPCYFWVFPECRYFCLFLSITKRDRRDGKKDARTSGKPAPPRPSFFKLTSL